MYQFRPVTDRIARMRKRYRDTNFTLDAERTLSLQVVKAVFAGETPGHFVVEASADEADWKKVADVSSWEKDSWGLYLESPVKARFVRFSFPQTGSGQAPSVAEIEVGGIVADL